MEELIVTMSQLCDRVQMNTMDPRLTAVFGEGKFEFPLETDLKVLSVL